MYQFSSGELDLVDPLADPSVDLIEGALERGVDGAEIGKCGCQARAQDAVIDAGEEQRCPESELGDAIAEAFGQAFDQAVEAQAAELIGDGALGDLLWGAAGHGGKMAAQIVATEAVGDLAEQNERLQELMGARVGKAQARSALLARCNRAVDALEGILGQHAVVAQTFDFEEPGRSSTWGNENSACRIEMS